jgi:hypothetical protein
MEDNIERHMDKEDKITVSSFQWKRESIKCLDKWPAVFTKVTGWFRIYNFSVALCLCSWILICLPVEVRAEVQVYDDIVAKGTSVMLRAETKGKFFKEGGKVVEFIVDGDSIGRTLSGGDAIAYQEYYIDRAGLLQITVKSGDEEDKGLVLSVYKGEGVLFIHVESSLFESVLSKRPSEGSLEAIDRISRKFHMAYLTSLPVGSGLLRKRLREIGFNDAPLIEFDGGRAFSDIARRGLKVKAVIGDSQVVSAAIEHSADVYSFREVEGAKEVRNWKEMEEILLKGNR